MLAVNQSVAIIAVILILAASGAAAIASRDAETGCMTEDVIQLEGSVVVTIRNNHSGEVSPLINLPDSQILECSVTKTGENSYYVDSVLKIDVDIVGNVSRQNLLRKYITTRISIVREKKEILPFRGLLKRWFIGKPQTISRIDLLSKGEKCVEMPLQYETSGGSENATMYIFVRWTPRLLFGRGSPVFAFERIHLEFVYLTSDDNDSKPPVTDSTPPVTICELEGKILRVDAT